MSLTLITPTRPHDGCERLKTGSASGASLLRHHRRQSPFSLRGEVMGKNGNVTCSSVLHERFTFDDMLKFATEAWGPLGTRTVRMWAVYNERYFGGALKPVPLVITHTQPFGRLLAFCSYHPDGEGRTITVNVPKDHNRLLADNGTLLHEMIHQYLFERGEHAGHDGSPWRREIMRLNLALAGIEIWAGPSKLTRVNKKVVRINAPDSNGRPSLTQGEIERWPHATGIRLGQLGDSNTQQGVA